MEEVATAGPSQFYDPGSFEPQDRALASRDPLSWEGYDAALDAARTGSSNDESVTAGPARIAGTDVELALFDFSFLGGSMGEVAGERLARGLERAAERGVPFILRTATGGARMQEGMRSLVQMPKVVAARSRLGLARGPLIAVLGNPTTGGVLASIAALADVTVAEAGATIGFAGPRVAEAFTGRPLTGVSHSAETALATGLVDEVITQSGLRAYLARVLRTLAADEPKTSDGPAPTASAGNEQDPWHAVVAARSAQRALGYELLLEMADGLIELRGDRQGMDDPSVDAAVARIEGRRVVVIALDRERVPGPGAFRKARRCLKIAERLGLPVVTFVDTRGADPGEDSEVGGIAWEIAQLFEEMLTVPVPTISIVTGEGGSGGALAFAATDVLLIYEEAVFSVIGPEMAAQILWRDKGRAEEAARRLKLGAFQLQKLGIADGVLPEPMGARTTAAAIAYHLGRLSERATSPAELVSSRLDRWRDRDAD